MTLNKKDNIEQIVAIDTNVFITMAKIDENYINKNSNPYGYYERLRNMKRKCISGTLKLVLLPQVFKEIMDVKHLLAKKEIEFLQNHCLILNPKNEDEYVRKVEELANAYVESGIMKDENGKPTSDVLIMAQATVAGLNLITDNYLDFFYYKKTKKSKRKIHKRADDIEKLNKNYGYKFITKSGTEFSPKPFTSEDYMKLFKEIGVFVKQANYKDFELLGR